ncbi:MAG: PrpF domain-containing protein [Giesbergeria sp.]
MNAQDLGYTGTELQASINGDAQALARFEAIRAHGALHMGLIQNLERSRHAPAHAQNRLRRPARRLHRVQRQTRFGGRH